MLREIEGESLRKEGKSNPRKFASLLGKKNLCVDGHRILTHLPLFARLFHRPTGFPSFLKWSWALPLHLCLRGLAQWLSLLSGGNTFLSLPCLEYLQRIWSCVPRPDRFPSCPAPFRVHHLYRQPCAWGTPSTMKEGSGGHRGLTYSLTIEN